jgi:hypothetical protein
MQTHPARCKKLAWRIARAIAISGACWAACGLLQRDGMMNAGLLIGVACAVGCATTAELNQDLPAAIKVVRLGAAPPARPKASFDQVAAYGSPPAGSSPMTDIALLSLVEVTGFAESSDAEAEVTALRRRGADLGCDGLLLHLGSETPSHSRPRRAWTAVCQVRAVSP